MLDQKLTSTKIKVLHIQSFFKKPKQADFSPVRVYLLCIRCEISSHICHIFEDSVLWLWVSKLLWVFRVLWPTISLLYFWMVSLNYVIPFFDCPHSQGVPLPSSSSRWWWPPCCQSLDILMLWQTSLACNPVQAPPNKVNCVLLPPVGISFPLIIPSPLKHCI